MPAQFLVCGVDGLSLSKKCLRSSALTKIDKTTGQRDLRIGKLWTAIGIVYLGTQLHGALQEGLRLSGTMTEKFGLATDQRSAGLPRSVVRSVGTGCDLGGGLYRQIAC